MSQKTSKAIRRSALKYARTEELAIAKTQMDGIYAMPFGYRLVFALGVIFKFGRSKTVDGKGKMKK
jgi:hypothetical protein